ncbi:OsmC family protein [Sphingobacterium faecale]|uniref:OsmC family protein n=1 Tax=Sphingobacterium faecale TaxID=2803775 RepID=A0ABS1R4X4_9SPHI|nr:OsmC family protein [Sphingobacterium faecale]MBL1409284.1 OsmC family protein [Sphingobacterium faecale]
MSEFVKQSLGTLIQELKTDTEKAKVSFEATSVLEEGVRVNSNVRQFEFKFDEPQLLGGQDDAPNPVEYVLASLGACQAIVYRALASLKGIQLENVTVKTKGDLNLQGFLGIDSNVRPGYEKITFETIIVSDEDPEKLQRLAEQVDAICPVLDIVSRPVKVEGKLTIQRTPEVVG